MFKKRPHLLGILFVLFVVLSASAAEPSRHAISIATHLNANKEDPKAGLEVGLFASLFPYVQIEYDLKMMWRLKSMNQNILHGGLGVILNFSQDFTNAFYLGAGVGYSTELSIQGDASSAFTYVQAGKRFSMSKVEGLSYDPRVRYLDEGRSRFVYILSPVNFTYFF